MIARNDITRALIMTKPASNSYRDNFDAIFAKKKPVEELTEATQKQNISLRDRFVGSLVGLAVGDAIGTTVEFQKRGDFEEVTDMVGGGPFNLIAGQWTDDTSLALCLAQSLLDVGFDPQDQLQKYVRWAKQGYLSSNGYCFDIGNTTRYALFNYIQTKEDYPGSTHDDASGNGSLMRLAPAVMFGYPDQHKIEEYASNSSRTTHGSPKAIQCCLLMADILASCYDGLPKNELLAAVSCQLDNLDVIGIAAGAFLEKSIDEIEGSGYCVESLEAALWCFFKTDSFDECVLKAVNLGRDADTTAAIAGQFAGAYYGYEGIRKEWREKITMASYIVGLAEKLSKNK